MPTPAFTPFLDAQTAYKAALGQDFFRQMQDNFTNLNSRVSAIESAIAVYDHFNRAPMVTPDGNTVYTPSWPWAAPIDALASPAVQFSDIDGWVLAADTDNTLDPSDSNSRNGPKPAFSVARIRNGNGWLGAFSRRTVNFNSMVRPIQLHGRFKLSADIPTKEGMRTSQPTGATINDPSVTDSPGIWVERVDATNWRFVSYDSSRNNGSSFAKPTPGTWWTMDVIFTDDPSNRALCYVNGVLKETFTSQLPTSQELRFFLGNGAAGDLDIDIASLRAEGIADAP